MRGLVGKKVLGIFFLGETMLKRLRQGHACLPSPWAVSLWHCHVLVPNPDVSELEAPVLESAVRQNSCCPAGTPLDQSWVAQPGLAELQMSPKGAGPRH